MNKTLKRYLQERVNYINGRGPKPKIEWLLLSTTKQRLGSLYDIQKGNN